MPRRAAAIVAVLLALGGVVACTAEPGPEACDPEGAWEMPPRPPERVADPAYTVDYQVFGSVHEMAEFSTLVATGYFLGEVARSTELELFHGRPQLPEDPDRYPGILVWEFRVLDALVGTVKPGTDIQVLLWGSFEDRWAALTSPERVGGHEVVLFGTDEPHETVRGPAHGVGTPYQIGLNFLPVGCDGLLEPDPLATVPLAPDGRTYPAGTSIHEQLGLTA